MQARAVWTAEHAFNHSINAIWFWTADGGGGAGLPAEGGGDAGGGRQHQPGDVQAAIFGAVRRQVRPRSFEPAVRHRDMPGDGHCARHAASAWSAVRSITPFLAPSK